MVSIPIEPNHRECATRTRPLLLQESSIGITNSDRYPPYLRLGAQLVPNTFQLTTSVIKVALMTQLIFHTFTATSGTSNGAVSVGLGLNPDPNTLPRLPTFSSPSSGLALLAAAANHPLCNPPTPIPVPLPTSVPGYGQSSGCHLSPDCGNPAKISEENP